MTTFPPMPKGARFAKHGDFELAAVPVVGRGDRFELPKRKRDADAHVVYWGDGTVAGVVDHEHGSQEYKGGKLSPFVEPNDSLAAALARLGKWERRVGNPKRSAPKRRRARNTSDEQRLLDELQRGKAAAKEGSKTWTKLLAKYQPLVDAGLVEVQGGNWPGAVLTLRPTPGARTRAGRVENPRPSLAQLGTLSEHGRVHELQVEQGGEVKSHAWRSGHPLLMWSPEQRALVLLAGGHVPRARAGVPRDDGAAATWERFHGKRASGHREVTIPAVELHELGRGVLVAYRGPKWRGRVAEHKLGRAVRVWTGASGNRRVFVVAGGNLRMTARGIEG